MANFHEVAFRPIIRSRIRALIRAGSSRQGILNELQDEFYNESGTYAGVTANQVGRMISQETRRQTNVDRVMAMAKSRVTNLHALLQCNAGQTIQAGVSLRFTDELTGIEKAFSFSGSLGNQGKLQDLLNPLLRAGVEEARGRGYTLQNITSSMTSGSLSYRINYLECVD